MLERLAQAIGISTTVAGALLALLTVQLVTQVYGLVDLARRDTVRGGRKWPWALVIVLGSLVGAVIYLVIGRHPIVELPGGDSRASAPRGDAARRAVEDLYGPRDRR